MQTKEEVLQACTVNKEIVNLPPIALDRKLYLEVAKALELIGGKWKGGKIQGFIFSEDPTQLLKQISTGEKRNLKKEFQFFGTPDSLADELVQDSGIDEMYNILEPSAGQGAIVKAITRAHKWAHVYTYELMPINRTFLENIKDVIILGEDFLKAKPPFHFDRIIANPPFTKNQDIDHIIKMYLVCKPRGRIVSIASNHWRYGQEKKCQQFREWLDEVNAEITDIPAGTFKESGTIIKTCKIIIDK